MIFQSWGPPTAIDRKSLPHILVKIIYRYNGQNMETTYIFRQVCVYVCVYVFLCTYVYVYIVCVCVYMQVHVFMYMYHSFLYVLKHGSDWLNNG